MRIASLLLAAGGSTRLGSPKQLLSFRGRSFLRRAAEALLATGSRPVIAVLGARATDLRAELAGADVSMVENTDWQSGMGTSIRLGLRTLLVLCGDDLPDAVALALCDQPLVGATELASLFAAFRHGTKRRFSLAAAAYSGTLGVPAVFGREHFAELLALPDEAGAKQVLLAHRTDLIEVPMPEAAVDIDTREQFERLTQPHDASRSDQTSG